MDSPYETYDYVEIRALEEGYTSADLSALYSKAGSVSGVSDHYLKIPPALRMWSADETFFSEIFDITLNPILTASAFEENPFRGTSVVNLWGAFDSELGGSEVWDTADYEITSCGNVVEYPQGFLRSAIPSIQFIVDTASISIKRVSTAIPKISFSGESCIYVIEPVTDDPDAPYTIAWDKCCFNLAEYLDDDLMEDYGITLTPSNEMLECSTDNFTPKQALRFRAPSECSGAIAWIDDEGKMQLSCPPTGDDNSYAFVWDNTLGEEGEFTWMLIKSCEEEPDS